MPIVVGLLVAAYVVRLSASPSGDRTGDWRFPACVSAGLLLWSAMAALREGPTGFWTEHTRNLWGNQIWFDLLFAAAIALSLLMPRARALGMRTVPWTLLVLASGSIGLLAMLARVRYLSARAEDAGRAPPAR